MKTAILSIVLLSWWAHAATPRKAKSDVVGIGISAVGRDYNGPCPVMVRFRATIYLTHVPMKVRYYWNRSNGVTTKEKVVTVAANDAPKINVADDFVAGMTGKSFRVTNRLHVLTDAGEVISDVVSSTGHCRQSR